MPLPRALPGVRERMRAGRSRGGFTAKIHALADAPGHPAWLIAAARHNVDITQAANLFQFDKSRVSNHLEHRA